MIGRLNWSGFKKAKNKPNLYYRNLPLSKIPNDSINVSYYYYIDGKRKQVRDDIYDHIISEIAQNLNPIIPYFDTKQGKVVIPNV